MKPSFKPVALLFALGAIQVRAADSYWTNISSSTTAVPWTNITAWSSGAAPNEISSFTLKLRCNKTQHHPHGAHTQQDLDYQQ